MRLVRLLAGATVGLLIAGCSGPQAPLTVGVRDVATNVVLKNAPLPEPGDTAVAFPPAAVPIAGPGALRPLTPAEAERFVPPSGPPPTTTPTPTAACPKATPFAAPRDPAVNSIRRVPAATTSPYIFRNDGILRIGGANPREERVEPESPRVVQNARVVRGRLPTDEHYTFEVAATLGGLTTTTTYRTVPELSTPPVESGGRPGLFIQAIRVTQEGREVSRFEPPSPLMLLPFPVKEGDTGVSSGTDPTTGVTYSYRYTVGARERADACGKLVDAFTVNVSDGRIVGIRNTLVGFSASYAVATQYGGITVKESVDIVTTEVGTGTERVVTSTINQVPLDAVAVSVRGG